MALAKHIFFLAFTFSTLVAELLPVGQTLLCASNPPQTDTGQIKQPLYNLFAAYLHTVPLEKLIESVEQARRDAQLRYVVIYAAACNYCLARAERLEGSYLRTSALELKEQLAQTLAAIVTSILT
jgi:hypothetical protein